MSRFRRGQFIPAIYLFFISHLLLFAFFFKGDATPLWLQRAFYIWLSVFNLFVVSVFWSFMADIFRPGQAQRLFGFIMAGGSIGAIIAPSITKSIVPLWGGSGVMYTASFILLLATLLAILLGPVHPAGEGKPAHGSHRRQCLGGCDSGISFGVPAVCLPADAVA